MSTQFGATALGVHETMDTWGGDGLRRGLPVRRGCEEGDCTDSSTRSTQPIARRSEGDGGTPTSTTTSTTGSTGNDTNSSSPEFNSLMNSLNSLAAGGAPMTPPLQDNSTPTVVPTQSTSKSASLAIVLFIIAGALGYYYYRKHGGASVHEAL